MSSDSWSRFSGEPSRNSRTIPSMNAPLPPDLGGHPVGRVEAELVGPDRGLYSFDDFAHHRVDHLCGVESRLAGSPTGHSRCAVAAPISGDASAAITSRTSGRSVTATARQRRPRRHRRGRARTSETRSFRPAVRSCLARTSCKKLGKGVIKHDPGFPTKSSHSEFVRSNRGLGRSRVEEPRREHHLADGANRVHNGGIVERHLMGDPLLVEIGARRAQHDCLRPSRSPANHPQARRFRSRGRTGCGRRPPSGGRES